MSTLNVNKMNLSGRMNLPRLTQNEIDALDAIQGRVVLIQQLTQSNSMMELTGFNQERKQELLLLQVVLLLLMVDLKFINIHQLEDTVLQLLKEVLLTS